MKILAFNGGCTLPYRAGGEQGGGKGRNEADIAATKNMELNGRKSA